MNQSELGVILKVKLNYHRKLRGMTLAQLASLSKVSTSQLSRMENGENTNPSALTLINIATALNTTVDKFLDLSHDAERISRTITLSHSGLRKLSRAKQLLVTTLDESQTIESINEEIVKNTSVDEIKEIFKRKRESTMDNIVNDDSLIRDA